MELSFSLTVCTQLVSYQNGRRVCVIIFKVLYRSTEYHKSGVHVITALNYGIATSSINTQYEAAELSE